MSSGEIQNAVVIRIANEHVPKHPLDAAKVLGIADEVGTELLVADGSERHVLAVDLQIFAVFSSSDISTLSSLERPIARSCCSGSRDPQRPPARQLRPRQIYGGAWRREKDGPTTHY